MNYELKKDGVDVLVVSPGPTQTEGLDNAVGIDFHKLEGPMMAPSRVARTALNNLGKRAHVIPGATNNSMDLMGKYLMPRWLSVRFYGWLFHRASMTAHGARHGPRRHPRDARRSRGVEVREIPEPHAGSGKVRVGVRAAGLNPMDSGIAWMPELAAT